MGAKGACTDNTHVRPIVHCINFAVFVQEGGSTWNGSVLSKVLCLSLLQMSWIEHDTEPFLVIMALVCIGYDATYFAEHRAGK